MPFTTPAGYAIGKIVCINVRQREDRFNHAIRELSKAGLIKHTEFLFADMHPEPKVGFCQSMVKALELCRGKGISLILEDDVVFTGNIWLDSIFKQLPVGWDMCYFGGNVRTRNPQRVTENLWRCRNTWTTHAVLYHPDMVNWVLEHYPVPQTITNTLDIYDEWLRVVAQAQKNCYIVKPFAAVQKEDWSDLENRPTRYGHLWQMAQRNLV